MRKKTKNLLLGGLGLVGLYVGYRYVTGRPVLGMHRVGAGRGLDYANPSDARSDHRPNRMWFLQPYQIFNPGGGMRPFEIDAQGAPTGRVLVLPGESPTPGAVVVSGSATHERQHRRGHRHHTGIQSGPAIVGGQSGPAIVGNGADYAGYWG